MKLAQSGTEQGIIKMINKFYYADSISVDFNTGKVSNRLGEISGVIVKKLKNKYIFKSI